jgi:AraC-like DNA-binding protein
MFRRTTGADLRRASFELRPHHRFVLIFNLATAGVVRIDSAETKLRSGEGLLILPYQFHVFPKTQREEILWLVITFECDRPAPLEQFRGKSFASAHRSVDGWFRYWSFIVPMTRNPSTRYWPMKRLACWRSYSPWFANPRPPMTEDHRSRQLLDDINGYLRDSGPANISVQDAAKRLNVSESRLRARFRAAFGSSLGSYLRNYRLHVAIERMRDTRRNFTEIASDLGFPDSATFTRFIRRQTRYTPSEFRSRLIR